MNAACPSCGFALVSADAASGACPECGMDADGRAALAHRSARAVRWAGAALGVVASIELLDAAHLLANLAIFAATTNEDARAAMAGELASNDRARAWMLLLQLALVTAAGLAAWRAVRTRAAPPGAARWSMAALAIAVPGAQLLLTADRVVPRPGPLLPREAWFFLWPLGQFAWYSLFASATAGAWLGLLPGLKRPRLLAPLVWTAFAAALFGALVVVLWRLGPPLTFASTLLRSEQFLLTITALLALATLRSWPHVHEPLPEHRPGDVVTLRHAMQMGGSVLGWALAMIGVLVWIVARSRPVELAGKAGTDALALIPSWMVARDVLAMLLVAAWVIPAFLVPDPRAAKTWKLAALISGAAAVLFAGR